jgi:hypothetical protein
MKRYLIDYEMSGTLMVDASNPQAAAMRGNAVLQAVAKGLNEEQPDATDVRVGKPIDLAAKCMVPS